MTAANSQRAIRAIAFSADGKTLATAGETRQSVCGTPRNRPIGSVQRTRWGRGTRWLCRQFDASSPRPPTKSSSSGTRIPPGNSWAASAPSRRAARLSASPFVGRVLCLAFNSDGTLLATGGGEPSRSGELRSGIFPRSAWLANSKTPTATRFSASSSPATASTWRAARPTSS